MLLALLRAVESRAAYVGRLAAWGLRGIQVPRPEHAPDRRAALARLARAAGLVATGGSDFHDPDGPLRPGDTGRPPLPASAIDDLLSDTVEP